MSTLNISKTIETPAGMRVTVTASIHTGCVEVETRTIFGFETHTVPWEKMEDMEALARIFADERVIIYQSIVEMLGKVYTSRHIYEALL